MDIEFVINRIEHLRTEDGASKRNMSSALEQSDSYISNITTGKSIPSLPVLFQICDYFNITPKDFFDVEAEYPAQLRGIIEGLHKLDSEDLSAVAHIVTRLQETTPHK